MRERLTVKSELKGEKVEIKLSGDGAQMSRSTNFMMFSFSLLQFDEKVMSSKGNRTVEIVNGPEKYETLKISFCDFVADANELVRNKTISVDGQNIELDLFLAAT